MSDLLDRSPVLAPVPGDPGRSEAFIPTPCVQNHAAFLHVLPGGALGCVWFGGTQEGVPDISVHVSRLVEGRWTDAEKLSDDSTRSEQNPLLFTAPDGKLWLLWTAQVSGHQDTAIVRHRISDDGGASWGPIGTLIDRPGLFIRQPIVIARNGDWLLPCWLCPTPPAGAWRGDEDTAVVMVSSDQGRSWVAQDVPGSTGAVHMNILPLRDGSMLALYRSRWADFIHASRSADGRRWSTPEPTELPNNNASIQARVLANGHIALAYNHSSAANATERRASLYDDLGDALAAEAPAAGRGAFWGAPRAPMTIALSEDGGRSWPYRRDVATGDGYCLTNNSRDRLNREFSYPSILQTPDGALHLAFTWWRQAIKHVRVSEDWVKGGAG
jgi:predicted neuraminidase